jgi:signal transduction histidine kinase
MGTLLSAAMVIGRDVRFFFSRFSRASVALVCAGFSVFALVVCVLAGVHFKRTVEQEGYRETQNIAQVLMAGFDDDAATADAILTRLAAQVSETDILEAHETELHRLLASYALQPSMIGPGILDRNGTLVASALADPVAKISLKDRNVFRAHAERPGESSLYIGTPLRGLITNEWAIQFSRPLRDPAGALYGVALLSYRLQHFVRLYEKLKLSERGLAGLTGKDGVVRVRTLNGVIGYGTSVPRNTLVYDRVIAGETSGTFDVGGGGPDDVPRIGSFVVSATTPFFVIVGYDTDYLRARYVGFFYLLGLCWLVLTVAMIAAVALVHRLNLLSQQAQLDVVNSAVAERQKISADMHDSIGASLAALLAYFTTENVNLADVRRRIGEILMELRFLVDSAETDGGDINLLLSNVRHRMGSGVELAGIDLDWRAGELPQLRALTARDALAIKLILMEALSNVLHHSQAKTATLTASYDPQASAIVISLADDGCGFDLHDAGGGRGLANMHKRTATISTGAKLTIDSARGKGTTVRLELQVPKVGTPPIHARSDSLSSA